MGKMPVDIEQRRAIIAFGDDMVIPELFVQCPWLWWGYHQAHLKS
jgi:hypothetical protein